MIRKVDEAHEQPPWSRFHTAGALTPLVCCLIVALLCVYPVFSSEADPVRVFEVRIDDQGLAQVHAVVELPARSDTVFAVLTDYARWPSLFSEGLTIASIRDDQDGVITDMYLPRILMPGTLHLVIRTRAPTRDRIEAELITGDLNRFWRLWHLTPLDGGRQTRADLQMTVQPKGWAPKWLVRYGIERELTDHFERLRTAVQARERQ